MRYELDKDGYVLNVYFGCYGTNCTEYVGNIPTGYETLVKWSEKANIRAYKIIDDNLVYDADRDAELQAQYEIDAERNAPVTMGYINDKLNEITSPFDENLKKTTTKLMIEDAGDYPIPEILIEVDEPKTFEDGIKLQVSNSNLAKITAVDETINGLTFKVNDDGTIHIKGTATADVEYEVCGTMDNTEPIFMLDCAHQIWGIDMIYILPYPVDGGEIDCPFVPKLYNYNGVDRELISDNYYIDFRENKFVKCVTCATLFFPSGSTIDQTIWLLIRKEDGTADYEQAKSKGVIDIPIKELNPGEKVVISGNYVKYIDANGIERVIKSIEPLVSYKGIADWDGETLEYDWTLLQYSDGIKVTTTYYTDIQLAGFDVTSDGLTTEIYSNYDYTQEDVDKAFAYVRNQTTLTEEELVKYDVNGDGVVNVYDVSYMSQLIKYGISSSTSLKFSICNKEQKSTFDFLKIIDGFDNVLTRIGAGGVDTNRLIVNGVDIFEKNYLQIRPTSDYTIKATNTLEIVPLTQQLVEGGSKLTLNSDGTVTIGAGVSRIKVSSSITWANVSAGTKNLYYYLNESNVRFIQSYGNGTTIVTIADYYIDVNEGDIFSLRTYGTAGEVIRSTRSHLSIEVVE